MLLRHKETTSTIFNRIYKENKGLYKTEFRLIVFSVRQTSKTLGKSDMEVMRELGKTVTFPHEMNNIIFDQQGNIKHYSVSAMTDVGKNIDCDSRIYTVK
jgi:hypothetical protein